MATALQIRNDIKKVKTSLKNKRLSAVIKKKLESSLKKLEGDLASLKSGKASKGVTKTKVLTNLQKLKARVKKTPSLAPYKNSGVDLEKDADQPALKTGRRVSKGIKGNQFADKKSAKGNVYYEYRVNRLDIKQPPKRYPKLEDGGMMAKGGMTKDSIVRTLTSDKNQYFLEKDNDGYILYISPRGAMNSTFHDKFNVEDLGNEGTKRKYRLTKKAEGGMMAKGGDILDGSVRRINGVDYLFSEAKQNEYGQYSGYRAYKLIFDTYDGEKYINYEKTIQPQNGKFFSNSNIGEEVRGEYFAVLGFKPKDGGMMAKGGKVSGRGWEGATKGERVKNIKDFVVGGVYLSYSPQFNSKNLIRIISLDKRGANSTIAYASYVRKLENDKDFAIWDYEFDYNEYYRAKEDMMADGGMMAKGGETKDEPKVIRGFSDDEAYEYGKGGGIDEIDMDEVEESAKFYALDPSWSTKPTIKKFQEEIQEKEILKNKLDNKLITPSKIIGSGFKPNRARPLAYKYLNEKILIYKRAIELLKERGEMADGGYMAHGGKLGAVHSKAHRYDK